MKKKIYIPLAILVAILSVVILFFSVTVPNSALWHDYIILYASKNFPEQQILANLENFGIKNIITLSKQKNPYNSEKSPIQLNNNSEISYLKQRNNYFFDESNSVQLYYIPQEYTKETSICIKNLKSLYPDLISGMDLHISYPFIIPILCVFAAVLFFIFSKFKLFMFISTLFPILYIFCLPSYSGGAAIIMFLYGTYLITSIWKRKNMIKTVFSNTYIISFFILPFILLFMTSFISAFLLIFVYIGTFSLLYLMYLGQAKIETKRSFLPIPIRSAKMIPIITHKTVKIMVIPIVIAAILCICFMFSDLFYTPQKTYNFFMPSPTKYSTIEKFSELDYNQTKPLDEKLNSKRLPNLTEYVNFIWNTFTFPYKSLNGKTLDNFAKIGDCIYFPSYTQNQDGFIIENTNVLYTFDEKFILDTMDLLKIEDCQIEYLLKNQNCFADITYAKTNSNRNTEKSTNVIISLLLAMIIPTFFCVFIWRFKR